jgi:hypothetical protein
MTLVMAPDAPTHKMSPGEVLAVTAKQARDGERPCDRQNTRQPSTEVTAPRLTIQHSPEAWPRWADGAAHERHHSALSRHGKPCGPAGHAAVDPADLTGGGLGTWHVAGEAATGLREAADFRRLITMRQHGRESPEYERARTLCSAAGRELWIELHRQMQLPARRGRWRWLGGSRRR